MAPVVLSLLVLLLFGGHAVADYGLQSAYVAEHKVAGPKNPDWFVTLGAHALIHAFLVAVVVLAVALLSAVPMERAAGVASALGWAELVVHFVIDHAKGRQKFSYRMDQMLHYGCKMLWAALLVNFAF